METIARHLRHVPGGNLPDAILHKLKVTRHHHVTIIPEEEVEYDDDGHPMPPESAFTKEFIKAHEESDSDFAEGKYKEFDTHEALMTELSKNWDKEDA